MESFLLHNSLYKQHTQREGDSLEEWHDKIIFESVILKMIWQVGWWERLRAEGEAEFSDIIQVLKGLDTKWQLYKLK